MTLKGEVNGPVFRQFVRARLVPWLRRGDVVVMDNLNMHESRAVRELIESAGALAVFLPTYSPEMNPIELLWAHLKRALRKLELNVEAELRRAVRRLRTQVPLSHIDGWYRRALAQARLNRSQS